MDKNSQTTPTKLYGRDLEIQRLTTMAAEPASKILVVYGRRRVGKTTLIQHVFENRNLIKIEGIENKRERFQREEFLDQLADQVGDKNIAKIKTKNWKETLLVANKYLENKEVTLYLEEIQWMADYKDNLISELKYVWDNYWQKNNRLILILCGSSPSFLINKIMKSRALYNRSQYEFPVEEISINAAWDLLGREKSINEVLDAYLLVGGIPEYLKQLKKQSSVYLSLINQSAEKGRYFVNEADRVFVSSLAKNENYQQIVNILGTSGAKNKKDIFLKGKIASGGTNTQIFNDLSICGFIGRYSPLKFLISKREEKFFIRDPYLQFYYKFIQKNIEFINRGDFIDRAENLIPYDAYRQHLGYALEKYCLYNHKQIATVLGFSGVKYEFGPYYLPKNEAEGVQIDMLFKRKDKVLTLIEVKYYDKPVGIEIINKLEEKVEKLRLRKDFSGYSIERVLVAPGGATEAVLSKGYFSKVIGISQLVGL